MRREVVRLLADRPMTENELAEALGLSDPSVGHHLKILTRAGLIRIARKEVEEHGIVQKFYETAALVYLVDDRDMPLDIQRYFTPARLERSRGMVAALSALSSKSGQLLAKDLEQFAKILDSAIVRIAPRYSKRWKGDREEIINSTYRDALTYLLNRPDRLPENVRTLLLRATKTR